MPRSKISTNGRSYRHAAARGLVKTLELVSPRRASAMVASAFLRPPRAPARPAREALLDRAVGLQLRVDGEVLRGFRLGEGPPVLLVHGWGGTAGQLAAFAAPLVAAGCAVVGFDAPAHGRSTGHSASVPQFASAVAAFARSVEARAAIGHSMGAAALALAISQGVKLDAAVLVSAPRAPGRFFEGFSAMLGIEFYTRELARRLIETRLGVRMADLDVARAASGATTPVLVVHDRDDSVVPSTEGIAIARAWPDSRLVVTRGLGHRRILKDPDVVRRAVAFVSDRLPRCACGRLASPSTGGAQCETCALDAYLEAREGRAVRAAC